jgi:hypothetical protein
MVCGPLDIERPGSAESDLTAALRTARHQHNYPAAIPWRPLCLPWHHKAHPELCLQTGPMFILLINLPVAPFISRSSGSETLKLLPPSRPRLATPSPALPMLHVLQTSRSATHRVRTRIRAPLNMFKNEQGTPISQATVVLHRQLLELLAPQALMLIESPNKPPVGPRTERLPRPSILRSDRFHAYITGCCVV